MSNFWAIVLAGGFFVGFICLVDRKRRERLRDKFNKFKDK